MKRSWFEYVLASVVLAVLAGIGYSVYWHMTHHCVRSHLEFVPAHDDTTYYPDSDGNPTIPITTHYDDAWKAVCDAWEENR